MTAALATMATACGRAGAPAPAAPVAPAQAVLSAEWIYAPATAETEAATGALTVEAQVDAQGPVRTVRAARGQRLRASLIGPVASAGPLGDALGARDGAAMLYRVSEGNLCAGAQATHVAWAEPELIEGRTLAIAALVGAPGETGSTVCRVLRYRRDRDDRGAR